jgi:hypothetical protein
MAIFHKGTKSEGRGRRQFAPSEEASYQMALTKLAKAGFEPGQIVVSGPEIRPYRQGKCWTRFYATCIHGTGYRHNQQSTGS